MDYVVLRTNPGDKRPAIFGPFSSVIQAADWIGELDEIDWATVEMTGHNRNGVNYVIRALYRP